MRQLGTTCVGLALMAAAAFVATAVGLPPAVQRPISDFVDAQGTYCLDDGMGGCFLFCPPPPNRVGWTDPPAGPLAKFVSVDYAGLDDEWITAESGGAISFDTQFSGQITEKPLPDGRALVNVRLHTENALTLAVDCPFAACDPCAEPTIFGNTAPDVLAGADAALGHSTLRVKFINTAPGAPLPDLLQLAFFPEPGQELIWLAFVATAEGTTPDGTEACMHVTQTGLFMTGFNGAVGDAYPAEIIDLAEGPCEE
jgi:hypothetical protein